MAWYYGTYSCGHEGRVNIIGPTKDRQRKSDWHFSGLCPECYKKQLEEERAAANKEAAEKSAEMELPTLTGTEKQIAWANTLRIRFVEEFNETFFGRKRNKVTLWDEGGNPVMEEVSTIYASFDWGIKSKVEARFWIDQRANSVTRTVFNLVEEFKRLKKEKIPEEIRAEILDEECNRTAIPECSEKKPGIAIIEFNEVKCTLRAKYIKDIDFMEIVKSLGYKWKREAWEREVTEYTGSSDDRAAELGNKLLLSGFTVQFPNMESKEKAVSANFSLENDRWIKYSPKTGKFFITWKGTNNTLYAAAKKLPSAKWTSGSMDVNIEFYREVQDFAKTMGFSISQKAQLEIEKYKKKESGFELAKISEHTGEIISDEKRLEKSLKSGGTILEDLKDD